jgi:hypothetical protein
VVRSSACLEHYVRRRKLAEERLDLPATQLPPQHDLARSSTPCRVNRYLDVSIAISLSSLTDGLLWWFLTTQHPALDAVGPSTPTATAYRAIRFDAFNDWRRETCARP